MEKEMATLILHTKEELESKALDMEKEPDTPNYPASTFLHVYHHNREKSKSYAIHTLRDSSTPITFPEKKSKKNKKSEEDSPAPIQPPPQTEQHEEAPQTQRPGLLKRISTQAARAKAYDNLKLDPRCNPPSNILDSTTQTTSYFLHLPTLYFHCPPYTLRKGGNKRAPVTALITPGCLWREWELEFGDVLREDGVIDGRGVVSAWAGTRDGKEGYLRGYKDRKRRWWGETGKKWFYEQKEKQEGGGNGDKLVEEEKEGGQGPRKPEEVVNVKWVAPIKRAREYRFQWRGFEFVWKGTGMVGLPDKKFARFRSATTRFSHLKLVVVVPNTGVVGHGEGGEIVLARYTSTMAKRKAGRLEVFEETVDEFVASHESSLLSSRDFQTASSPPTLAKTLESGVDDVTSRSNEKQNPFKDPSSPTRDLEKIRERLKDLVVASGMCMVIGEFEKREVLYAVLLLLLEAAQNGGG